MYVANRKSTRSDTSQSFGSYRVFKNSSEDCLYNLLCSYLTLTTESIAYYFNDPHMAFQ